MMREISVILGWIIDLIKLIGRFTFWDGVVAVLFLLFISTVASNKRKRRYKIGSISANLPFTLGNITYEPTVGDRAIAWKLYVQLITRKAALPFDEENDLISDVYDSLYDIFAISRDLLMELQIDEVENGSMAADLIIRVQNDGLRPHLTKWQADFRRWWGNAILDPQYKDKRLQDIQKEYPNYQKMVVELKEMNQEINKYAEQLLNIAKGPQKKEKPKEYKVVPEQPS